MKFLVVLSVVVACVVADDVVKDEASAPIVKSTYDVTPEGGFQWAFETANGIYVQSSGSLKNSNSDYPSLEIKGEYKYSAPDGTPIELSYVADELGYKPVGKHLPVSPPIPELILRSLEYIAAHPPPVVISPSSSLV